jgi:hypothetical protein
MSKNAYFGASMLEPGWVPGRGLVYGLIGVGGREPGFPGARNWFLPGRRLAPRPAVSLAPSTCPGLALMGLLVVCWTAVWSFTGFGWSAPGGVTSTVWLSPGWCLAFAWIFWREADRYPGRRLVDVWPRTPRIALGVDPGWSLVGAWLEPGWSLVSPGLAWLLPGRALV